MYDAFSAPSGREGTPPVVGDNMVTRKVGTLVVDTDNAEVALLVDSPFTAPRAAKDSQLTHAPRAYYTLDSGSSPGAPTIFFTTDLPVARVSSDDITVSSDGIDGLLPTGDVPSRFCY